MGEVMVSKIILGHEVDEKFIYPKNKRCEWDKGLSWKPIETPNNYPTYIIPHFTCSYELEGTVGYFQKEGVSVHFVVGKKGEVVQMAPVNMRCAHAGSSVWNGNNDLNRFSIGIEVVNLGPLEKRGDKFYDCWDREYKGLVRCKNEIGFKYWEPWTEEQEQAVKDICLWACESFDIDSKNIADHAEVAPRRKNDPGGSSEMTGDEFREYIKKRLSDTPIENPKNKVYIFKTADALLKNYGQVQIGDKILLRIKKYGKCVICEERTPPEDNMVCEQCHKIWNSNIVVL